MSGKPALTDFQKTAAVKRWSNRQTNMKTTLDKLKTLHTEATMNKVNTEGLSAEYWRGRQDAYEDAMKLAYEDAIAERCK